MSTRIKRPRSVRASSSHVAAYVRGFVEELLATGYSPCTAREHLRGVLHLGRWADAVGIATEDFDDRVVARFRVHLTTCRCHWRSKGKLRPARVAAKLFLAYLRRAGVVPIAGERPSSNPSPLLTEFRRWMQIHRGVALSTLDGYERVLLPFLAAVGEDPARYNAARLRAYVLECTRHRSRTRAKWVVNAMRALLRFLAIEGRCAADLVLAVPTVPEWRLSSLPRHLEPEVVEQVIEACDISTVYGLRDRAILLLLARLGLRAGDIVAMRLGDIDWTGGRLRVRGKGRREAVLPLPQPVGDALLAYLERGRPRVALDAIFLCAQAPYRAFASTASVSDVVRLALRRAGVHDAPSRGAHLLRHSAATAMLRGGATLEAIATVLRHKSPETTVHYAKLDVRMLQQVAQPWPEVAPC